MTWNQRTDVLTETALSAERLRACVRARLLSAGAPRGRRMRYDSLNPRADSLRQACVDPVRVGVLESRATHKNRPKKKLPLPPVWSRDSRRSTPKRRFFRWVSAGCVSTHATDTPPFDIGTQSAPPHHPNWRAKNTGIPPPLRPKNSYLRVVYRFSPPKLWTLQTKRVDRTDPWGRGGIYHSSSPGTENVNTGLYSLCGGCELSLLWRNAAWREGETTKSCLLGHMCASIIHAHTQTHQCACKINQNSTRVSKLELCGWILVPGATNSVFGGLNQGGKHWGRGGLTSTF